MSTRRYFQGSGAFNGATAVDIKDPGATGTAYVTKFTISIVTHANAKFVGLQDSTGTPVVFCKHNDLTAAAGVPSVITYDFGKKGIPMTAAKKVQLISEGSGPAGYGYVEGYVIR